MKILYFLFPTCKANNARNSIKEKQECLNEPDRCRDRERLKALLEEEINKLPENMEELKELLDKEFRRKEIIEEKAKSMFIVTSLLGIIISFFYNIIEVVVKVFLYIIGFLTFIKLVYLILSVSSLFAILVELNIIYEPLSKSTSADELKKAILLNRYQNLIRTNYLNSIYLNIKRFFWLLLIIYSVLLIYLLTKNQFLLPYKNCYLGFI